MTVRRFDKANPLYQSTALFHGLGPQRTERFVQLCYFLAEFGVQPGLQLAVYRADRAPLSFYPVYAGLVRFPVRRLTFSTGNKRIQTGQQR